MAAPKLAVAKSGYGGRGYKHPLTGQLVPSVTTILRVVSSPALDQWRVDQTAAYAVANIDSLLTRTEEQGWGFLRWYHGRDPKQISEGFDVRNYHIGVLNDAAELGTSIHEYIEADANGWEMPDTSLESERFWQMVTMWDQFKQEHTVEPVLTETTVWNAEKGYAGTFDGLWKIDGKLTLLDIKSARGIWPDHFMQLGALKNATTFLTEGFDGWIEQDWDSSKIESYGFLHIRPDDVDNNGKLMLSYCNWEDADANKLDMRYEQFLGLLLAKQAELRITDLEKLEAKELKKQALSTETFGG